MRWNRIGMLLLGAIVGGPVVASAAVCGNPHDLLPDDRPLQDCLDRGGTISLEPGLPGYIVNGLDGDVRRGLRITRSLTLLTSSGGVAKIIAGRDFYGTILSTAGGLSNVVIRNLYFDGMVDELVDGEPYRRRREDCVVGGDIGIATVAGSGFIFENNVVVRAMCGSGLGVSGTDFFVVGNYVAHNGRDKYARRAGFPWADGITVIRCERGYIAHNTLVDNTDIDLVIGGGNDCVVELNTIAHFAKYAFAGLNIGGFDGDGDHEGSEFRGNTIYSGIPNKLAMGLLVGSHPWTTAPHALVTHAGRVVGNRSHGNVFNLVVEGVEGGVVDGNILENHRGNDSNCGRFGENYIVNPTHVSNVTLQPGWTAFQFDEWRCGPL